MSQAVSFGQITITDLTDVGTLSVYPSGNLPHSVIFNPDQSTFTPNWGDSGTHLVLTPVIYYGGRQLTPGTDSGLIVTWTRQQGSATPTALTTGEDVTNGVLTVSTNKFTSNSTTISYIVTVNYTEPETSAQLTAEGKITFTLVKQASTVKTCSITGDTIFKYKTDQTIVQTSITLTGYVSDNLSLVAWQYQNSSGNWVTYPGSNTSATLVVNQSDSTFVNDKCIIKLVTSDNSVYDLHTITKLRDGAAGTNVVTAVLSNEDQMIPCDANGNPTSFEECESQLTIYRGGEEQTSSWTITLTPSNVTYQVSADGINWNSSGTSGNWSRVRIIGITSDTGSITFTANKTGEDPVIKVFSLIKVKTGANGQNAIVYSIVPATVAINANADNTVFTPSQVVVSAYSKEGSSAKQPYQGRIRIYAGSTSGTIIHTTGDTTSYTITTDNINSALSAGYMTVVLYEKGGTSIVLDSQTIVITSDGVKGEDGDEGEQGPAAINVILGNQADVIPCTSDNKTSSQMIIKIPFNGYEGITKVECNVSTPPILFEQTAQVTQATASVEGLIQYTIPAGTSISNESGIVSFRFSCQGQQIPMDYRWTRSTAAKDGKDGVNAVILQLHSPSGTVVSSAISSVTINATLIDGSTEVTNNVTSWLWEVYDGNTSGGGDGYSPISGQTSSSLTRTRDQIDSFASIRCTATYNSKNYVEYIAIIDSEDPLQVAVLSSIGEQIINGLGAGAFYVLCHQGEDEVDPIKSTRFLETAPTTAATGDFYYHVDSSAKTVTLMRYNGSAWKTRDNDTTANKPLYDYTGAYAWTHLDKDGNAITSGGPATSGKVIYVDGSLFYKKMISTVKVTL